MRNRIIGAVIAIMAIQANAVENQTMEKDGFICDHAAYNIADKKFIALSRQVPDASASQVQIDLLRQALTREMDVIRDECESTRRAHLMKLSEARTKEWAAKDAEAARVKALPGARIGMTPKQVIEKTSWGKPHHINTTTTSRSVSEQWVYGDGNYLYFENGKLTAIQN